MNYYDSRGYSMLMILSTITLILFIYLLFIINYVLIHSNLKKCHTIKFILIQVVLRSLISFQIPMQHKAIQQELLHQQLTIFLKPNILFCKISAFQED